MKKHKKHFETTTNNFFRKLFPQYEMLSFYERIIISRDNFFFLSIRQSKRYVRIESPGLYMWKTVVNINTFVLIKIKTILLKATLIHSNGAYL